MPATKRRTEETPVLIGTRDLKLGYGSKTILANVNLEVRAGDWWFIAGANGSGKTTLMNSLLGLVEPLGGELFRPGGRRAAEMIGFVPQRCEFNNTLPVTVDEFVLLGLTGMRVSRGEERERLLRALALVGLTGKGDERYWTLSGGQRQRALLARALIRRPPVLFLDEPTNELDVRARRNFLRLLERIHQDEGVTILLVTHQIELVEEYGTHAIIISDGAVMAGEKKKVFTKENLGRLFGERTT